MHSFTYFYEYVIPLVFFSCIEGIAAGTCRQNDKLVT